MKTIAQIEELHSFYRVTYYSVRVEDSDLNEIERFIQEYKDLPEFREEFYGLYCIRINENIVILLNGGGKTSQKVQDSPDLLPKFRLANKISEAVTKSLSTRNCGWKGKS